MKLKNLLLGVTVGIASTTCMVSCKKETLSEETKTDIVENYRTTGAIEEDPNLTSSIPLIVSSSFLEHNPNLSRTGLSVEQKGRKDNASPTVYFITPTYGSSLSGATMVNISASDNVGVTSVTLTIDGATVSSMTAAPYSYSWNTASATNGTHTLKATAKDAYGNISTSTTTVTVSNVVVGDITKPVVTITSPGNSASVSGSVTVSVSASDNVGVTKVEFRVDGSLQSSSNNAPCNFAWNSSGYSNGSHSLAATAYDAAGNTSTHTIQVTLNATVVPPTQLPLSHQIMMPPVRSQGSEGACVSFVTAYAVRSAEQYYKTNASAYSDATNVFSPEYVFNQVNLNGTCTSSGVVSSLELIKSQGVCTWQSMPYSTYNGCSTMPNASQKNEAANFKIQSYSTVISNDEAAIKSLLAGNHPLIVTCSIDQQFSNATPGYIWNTFTTTSGYHAITLCGYDDNKHAYKAMNSWGTGWGDAGYIWIDYDFLPTVSSYYLYTIQL